MITIAQNLDGTLTFAGFSGTPSVLITETTATTLTLSVPDEMLAKLPVDQSAQLAALQAKIDAAKRDLS